MEGRKEGIRAKQGNQLSGSYILYIIMFTSV